MIPLFDLRNRRTQLLWFALIAVFAGLFLRFWNLGHSGFFFYDEGLYLSFDLPHLELIRLSPPQGVSQNWSAFLFYLKNALASGKSLWFLVIDSRFLLGGIHNWAFAKYAAAFFGILSLPLVYAFARRFYGSKEVALLSVGIMALLPGMVFYSRIALQEALSIFLVLAGLYFYFFPRAFGWRTFVSGLIMGAAFLSNYRLLMLPVIVLVVELWFSLIEKKGGGLRKYIWFSVTFFSCVILIGNLLDAANSRVIFAWVFHQEQMAGGQFLWVNLFSYPYYLFRLETWPFALFFFGNIYFVVRKRWEMILPLVMVLAQMAVFSLTAEKGARYLAVMLPFAVMGVAALVWELLRDGHKTVRVAAFIMGLLMVCGLSARSFDLAKVVSAHEEAVKYLQASKGEDVKFFSSQEQVDVLYLRDRRNVKAVAHTFPDLLVSYEKGFRTLLLDPQAYVSLCHGEKFTSPLRDYLAFIDGNMQPVKTFRYMNRAVLERFVLEHSENLALSVRFLADKDLEKFATLRVYDLDEAVPAMKRIWEQWQMLKRK
jgi:hypothetical protein